MSAFGAFTSAVLAVGILGSCRPDTPTSPESTVIGPTGGSAVLRGAASFEFPPAFFPSARTVEVTRSQDAVATARFTGFQELFQIENKADGQIRVLAGRTSPTGGTFTAVVTVPASLVVPSGSSPALFAQVYEAGGHEVLDNFQLFASAWDPAARTLTAAIPAWVLTNTRRADGLYEALFMIATRPSGGATNTASLALSLAGTSYANASDTCSAPSIGRPLPANIQVSSPFGLRTDPITGVAGTMHWGTDFAAPSLTSVFAVADGTIFGPRIDSGDQTLKTGYGLYLILLHTNGSSTLYAHLDNTTGVSDGMSVRLGDPIAQTDNTGNSTGPHLHFEYVPSGNIIHNVGRIDPVPCIHTTGG